MLAARLIRLLTWGLAATTLALILAVQIWCWQQERRSLYELSLADCDRLDRLVTSLSHAEGMTPCIDFASLENNAPWTALLSDSMLWLWTDSPKLLMGPESAHLSANDFHNLMLSSRFNHVFLAKPRKGSELSTGYSRDAQGTRWLISIWSQAASENCPKLVLFRKLTGTPQNMGIWWLLVQLVLSVVAAALSVHYELKPLQYLTQSAQGLISGQEYRPIQVQQQTECAVLAAVLNTLSYQLQTRVLDLEEQRKQLEVSHARLETILESMREGVVAVAADESIIFANQAATRLLELNPRLLGRPIWELIRHTSLQQQVQTALRGETPPQSELEIARTHSIVQATTLPLPGKPPPGALLVLQDITELRKLESHRREFVQNVSHELKTPLSAISAYTETLLEGGLEDQKNNRRFVEAIAENAERLHELILNLLTLARLEAHTADEVAWEAIDLGTTVERCVHAQRSLADSKGIALQIQPTERPLFVLAEAEGVRAIIDNLLNNAIKYTPPQGKVVLRWYKAGERIALEVEDTGVGIAREHQSRIFERFYRIDRSRSREDGGTGLGLAIVKHWCQLFQAGIHVQSQLGRGSIFVVHFKPASPQSCRATSPQEGADCRASSNVQAV